jgi:hypothetical protein
MDSPSAAMLQFVCTQLNHTVNTPYVKELKETIRQLRQDNEKLKRDNSDLQLQDFRKDHSYTKLRKLQKKANRTIQSLRCGCSGCYENCIWKKGEDATQACRFSSWFRSQLEACHLTYTHITENNLHEWDVAGLEHTVYDVDTDFVELRNYYNGTYISKFVYGPSILYSTDIYDEPLGRLDHLFDNLRDAVYEALES